MRQGGLGATSIQMAEAGDDFGGHPFPEDLGRASVAARLVSCKPDL